MKHTLFLVTIICLTTLAACGGSSDEPTQLTVFAAASLTDAFDALAEEFEARNEGVKVQLNFASSSALATQIVEGADADIFASANPQQMQKVADAGELVSDPQTFAGNRLVVAVNAASDVGALQDLTAEGVTIVLAAPGVPIRVYTDESLALLDIAEGVLQNTVSEEPNVRAAVLKVALGEADATFAYASDITPDVREDLRAIDIPPDYNVLAAYPIAATSDNRLAEAFIDFALSEDGQAILVGWGFLSAPG